MKTLNRLLALFVILVSCLLLTTHGTDAAPVVAALLFISAAAIAGPAAIFRGQLGVAPDTNDLMSQLNLNEILDSAIVGFRRAILNLQIFATVFRDQQLQGTDKVEVPYYPLQGSKSKDFAGTYDFGTGAGSNTLVREVTINKRKYQPMAITGRELSRLPMLNAQTLGRMKGEKLAYDVIQDILSMVTAANFPGVAFTGAPATFDSYDVVDIRTACNKNSEFLVTTDGGTTNGSTTVTSATASFTPADVGLSISGAGIPANTIIASVTNAGAIVLSAAATATGAGVTLTLGRPLVPWPQTGRGLLLNPDYDGALLKDSNFMRDYTVAQQRTILTAELPQVYGFGYGQSAAIPTNGENLVGMATYMSAILCAFSPIEPPKAVRAVMTQYEIATDPDTGISLEYRVWGDPNTDTEKRVIECNYGYALGESQAIKRLKSA